MDCTMRCFKKSAKIVDRLIDDEIVIVPVSPELSRQGNIYNLEPVGAKIWQMINGRNTVEQIRDHIIAAMDVSPEQAEKDLIAFLKDLEDIGAIEEVKNNV
jgi:hypothetical protein